MSKALQIVLPTDDLRVSLITQINTLRKGLGRTPAVLRRSVNKRYGVAQGIDDLTEAQLSDVLCSLEQINEHLEAVERVYAVCAARRMTAAVLDAMLEIHFEGRALDQLSSDELIDLRVRIEVEEGCAAGIEPETAATAM
jgi:hypothetical protein